MLSPIFQFYRRPYLFLLPPPARVVVFQIWCVVARFESPVVTRLVPINILRTMYKGLCVGFTFPYLPLLAREEAMRALFLGFSSTGSSKSLILYTGTQKMSRHGCNPTPAIAVPSPPSHRNYWQRAFVDSILCRLASVFMVYTCTHAVAHEATHVFCAPACVPPQFDIIWVQWPQCG
jgi:hypothetical protein